MTAMEVLLLITDEHHHLFYDPFELCVTYDPVNKNELDRFLKAKKEENEITDIVSNIMLPTFQEIDHETLMRIFVKQCVEDKEIRKTLFCILRRHYFVTPFVDKLKELGLYDDYEYFNGLIYNQILCEWAESHGIDLKKQNK